MTPVLLLGAGRMGGAMIEGWRTAGPVSPSDLLIRDPHPGPEALACGAAINPPDSALAAAPTVILAVKPQLWREAAAAVAPYLRSNAIIVSIAAGVGTADISQAFEGRRVARVMPTTAVAVGQGTASVYAADDEARARAHDLFATIASVVDLHDEGLMHAATAVSGSGPAYLYAFVEALEAAGVGAGLSAEVARTLAASTVTGAAALLSMSDQGPAELRRQVTSPGGTTEAALKILMGAKGLDDLLATAVAAAVVRSRELG